MEIPEDLLNDLHLPSRLESIYIEELQAKLLVKRDDLIHPIISGNKWRKLVYHLKAFKQSDHKGIISMGGVYSNHLHALSFVCHQLKIPCQVLIYGWHQELLTPTQRDMVEWSSQLTPISRQMAQLLRDNSQSMDSNFPSDYYWIPEGGGGDCGIQGMADLINELPMGFDHENHLILCACGTGTSLQGLLKFTRHVKIASLKKVKQSSYGFKDHPRMIWIPANSNESFGKISQQGSSFVDSFYKQFQIPLDFIYTGPLMKQFLASGLSTQFEQIYFIHTGGLQGNRDHT